MDAELGSDAASILRILAAGGLGALFGLDRERLGKPLGFRTLGIVAIASCVLTVAAVQHDLQLQAQGGETVGRAIQGLMAGIGFLGGGVILHHRNQSIRGLTTAALVWLTAALGIACGLGAWTLVVTASGLALALLWIGRPLEAWLRRIRARTPTRIVRL